MECSERKRIRDQLRTKIGRGSLRVAQISESKEPLSEDQLMHELKLLEPRGEGFAFLKNYDAFQFYWRHPWTRLLFVVSLWTLDLYIFGEDPTTYSQAPCRIGGAGHILNLIVAFDRRVAFQWHLLRLALLVGFVAAGLVISKKLKRRLALRFEMFTYKGSYFIIGAAVITMNLLVCAKVYNSILWRLTCVSESCDCEDPACLPGVLSSNLHIPNNVFARLTQCGAFLADTLAVFSVLDLILQDQSVYDFKLCSGMSWDLHSFWERNRTRVLWGSFTVIATSGVIVLAFFSGKVLNSYQLSPSMHRSNIGRMVVAGMLFIIDVCIVTQDLDFPHFENSLEVKLLGTNIAFEGSFINYIMVVVSMLLDLNCLYTLGWYDPFAYGQYYLTNASVCNRRNISDILEVNCSSHSCPVVEVEQERWANLTSCGDDELLGARYYPAIGYRSFLAAAPVLCGILLFCSLFRLAGRSPQNLCRRVVISNAFAVRRVQESVEMVPVTVKASDTAAEPQASERRLALLAECGASSSPHVHRVLVVTAYGVKAFELRDTSRAPLNGRWMRPHVFCTRLRLYLQRSTEDLVRSSCRDYLYLRVEDLKAKLWQAGYVRDVPFHSLELLWQGRLLHNRTFLRSLGSDAVLFLLHDRWDLRAKVLAARRSRVTDLEA